MGTSFVGYRERGFWSWDGYLEHLLFLLSETIRPSPDQSWLTDVREHWREQASGAYSAWIRPNLDEYITSEERRSVILELLAQIVSTQCVTQEVLQTADLMSRLLARSRQPNPARRDYMVNGKHPYEWWVHRNATMGRE
jgi:hypothetical protein